MSIYMFKAQSSKFKAQSIKNEFLNYRRRRLYRTTTS